MSLQKATLLITFMSAGSAVGKLIYGKVSDYFQSYTQTIYIVSMFTSGLSSILFSFVSTSYVGLVLYVTLFGLLDGSFIGLMSIMTIKCTGSVELMSHSWGISLMFMSCSMIVGPPTVGKFLFYLIISVTNSKFQLFLSFSPMPFYFRSLYWLGPYTCVDHTTLSPPYNIYIYNYHSLYHM